MKLYKQGEPALKYASPSEKLSTIGGIISVLALVAILLIRLAMARVSGEDELVELAFAICNLFIRCCGITLSVAMVTFAVGIVLHFLETPEQQIYYAVRKRLWCSAYGNPLSLKDGARLPSIKVKPLPNSKYVITISASSMPTDSISKIANSISSSLDNCFDSFAVTETDSDIAHRYVEFIIEDVTADRAIIARSVQDLDSGDAKKLLVQRNEYIDLTTSGSMLFAGKTRSGKTTGVISLILQVLQQGRDKFGSQVLVVDPKQAELSRLPFVVSLTEDGKAIEILNQLKAFAASIVRRQTVLNDLSDAKGDAVKWWEAGMHVSLVFIDEYVALRSIFPRKAPTDNPDYCLETFDSLIKRIVTMGASAGCYVIISIAEASVDSGGLPAMLRDAMSTRVLFRPTLREARFLWDSALLEDMPQRTYNPGDAWFSSTDGVHDGVSYVHFPVMDFPVYRELGRLLEEYYSD